LVRKKAGIAGADFYKSSKKFVFEKKERMVELFGRDSEPKESF